MSRPIYERPEDRNKEREAMVRLEQYLTRSVIPTPKEIKAVKAPELYPYDFEVLIDGKVWGLVEVKCRTNKMGDYPNYMISERKLRVLREEAHKRGVSPFLLVSWSDKSGLASVINATARGIRAYGGRYDRNDPADHEVVIHIPHSVFAIIDGEGKV